MSLETSVTLDDVFVVVNAKRVPLAPELAGYLVLEIAERADAAGGDVDPKFVFIGEEGTVGLVRPRREGATGDAELSIRSILARLLEASGSLTPALASAAKRKGAGGLPSLVEELEAALIPVNRAAGRRALARLAREVKRVTLGVGRNAQVAPSERAPRGSSPSHVAIHGAETVRAPQTASSIAAQSAATSPAEPAEPAPPMRSSSASQSFDAEEEPTNAKMSSIPPRMLEPMPPVEMHDASALPTIQFTPPARAQADSVDNLIATFGVSPQSDQAVSRELKAMVGLDPTPPPPMQQARKREDERDGDVDALLALSGEASEPFPPPPATPPSGPRPGDRQLPTGPSKVRRGSQVSITNEGRKGGPGGLLIVLSLVLLALAAVAVWRLKPGFLSGRTQEKIDAERAAAEADRQRAVAQQQAAACRASLLVTDVPANAEVLMRVGQAPVDVDKMPVGTHLEFVATAEGYAPHRAEVQAGATWDSGSDGKTRIELAVQLEKSKAKPGAQDLWPAGEPGVAVGGNGPPGTVHIVSTPKGADVWLLVGVGPEAKIEQLVCGTDVDVLVAGPTALRKHLKVVGSDFVSQESDPTAAGASIRTARVSAK